MDFIKRIIHSLDDLGNQRSKSCTVVTKDSNIISRKQT